MWLQETLGYFYLKLERRKINNVWQRHFRQLLRCIKEDPPPHHRKHLLPAIDHLRLSLIVQVTNKWLANKLQDLCFAQMKLRATWENCLVLLENQLPKYWSLQCSLSHECCRSMWVLCWHGVCVCVCAYLVVCPDVSDENRQVVKAKWHIIVHILV